MGSKIVPSEGNLTEQHHFTWKIHNFASARTMSDGEIRSNLKMGSRIGLPYDCKWTCSLIRSPGSSYLNTLRIELTKKPIILKDIGTSCRVMIKRQYPDSSLYYDSTASPYINMVEQTWACKLIPSLCIANLPLDQVGTLEVVILVKLHSPKYKAIEEILGKFKVQFTEKLQSDFANMLKATALPQADSPTVIICKGDNLKFPVNRGMLAARSSVFLRMFQSKMKEEQSGIVEVSDVSSEVIKIILHFLYTGILQENWNNVCTDELLYAAAKYEIKDLLEFLDVVVGQICTQENAGKLISLARKLNLKSAEKDLFNFIKASCESYEQFEKIMDDAKSDIGFEQMFLTNLKIESVGERQNQEDLNEIFDEINSDELDLTD